MSPTADLRAIKAHMLEAHYWDDAPPNDVASGLLWAQSHRAEHDPKQCRSADSWNHTHIAEELAVGSVEATAPTPQTKRRLQCKRCKKCGPLFEVFHPPTWEPWSGRSRGMFCKACITVWAEWDLDGATPAQLEALTKARASKAAKQVSVNAITSPSYRAVRLPRSTNLKQAS